MTVEPHLIGPWSSTDRFVFSIFGVALQPFYKTQIYRTPQITVYQIYRALRITMNFVIKKALV